MSENMDIREENISKSMQPKLMTPNKIESPRTKTPQSDFKYFALNQDHINNSIDRSTRDDFIDTVGSENRETPQEFGEFGMFKNPKSKFAVKEEGKGKETLSGKAWMVKSSEDFSEIGKVKTENLSNQMSISPNRLLIGPKLGKTPARVFEKFENSSVHIIKSEFKSIDNSNSTSKINEVKSEEVSKESMHLKVKKKSLERVEQEREPSRDSMSTLKGSMLSEIFCLDTKKKAVPPSKFSQKMKKNSKYIAMIKNKTSQRSIISLKSKLILSNPTLSEIQKEDEQTDATIYFFKALLRLARIFLEKLKKPKHSLKCLLFLEKNHQVDSSQVSKRLKEQKAESKKMKSYLRVIGSSDSIEDYIRETQNKVSNMYSPSVKKTRLLPQQASNLFYLLGKTFLSLEEYSKAEEKLVLSHVYDKSNFDSLFLLAEMNFKLENFKRAERFYRKAHYNDLSDNRALLGLAECNLREKNFDFLAQFAKYLDFDLVRSPEVCLLFSTSLLELLSKSNKYPTNHNKELFGFLRKFLKKAENCLLLPNAVGSFHSEINLRNQIAQKYFRIKDFQSGINCLNLLNENSMSPLTLYNLAYAYFKIGNLSHSIGFLNKVLVVKPLHRKSLLLKAEICKKKGDLKTSQSILQSLIEKDPSDPVINRMLGDVFKFKGSFFQAIEHYEVSF